MSQNDVTLSLEDSSFGYKISPERVPSAVLAAFAGDVCDFLKGSGRETDIAQTEVSVVKGSLAIRARDAFSPSLVHDLRARFPPAK